MIVTVLNGAWEVDVAPAKRKDVPNGIYLTVRHKPNYGGENLFPGGIRFGLTEAEVSRIIHALLEGTVGEGAKAKEAQQSLRKSAGKDAAKNAMEPERTAPKPRFTKVQGSYLLFIHRYMTKFGRAPAESDIQRRFMVSAPSVNAMMQTLTRKGFISRIPGIARSIQLQVPPEELPAD